MAETTQVKRHPLAIAWDKWLASAEGTECRTAGTLAHDTNVYLENRLHRAFMAGADATNADSEQFDALRKAAVEVVNRFQREYNDLTDGQYGSVEDFSEVKALRRALGKEQ